MSDFDNIVKKLNLSTEQFLLCLEATFSPSLAEYYKKLFLEAKSINPQIGIKEFKTIKLPPFIHTHFLETVVRYLRKDGITISDLLNGSFYSSDKRRPVENMYFVFLEHCLNYCPSDTVRDIFPCSKKVKILGYSLVESLKNICIFYPKQRIIPNRESLEAFENTIFVLKVFSDILGNDGLKVEEIIVNKILAQKDDFQRLLGYIYIIKLHLYIFYKKLYLEAKEIIKSADGKYSALGNSEYVMRASKTAMYNSFKDGETLEEFIIRFAKYFDIKLISNQEKVITPAIDISIQTDPIQQADKTQNVQGSQITESYQEVSKKK